MDLDGKGCLTAPPGIDGVVTDPSTHDVGFDATLHREDRGVQARGGHQLELVPALVEEAILTGEGEGRGQMQGRRQRAAHIRARSPRELGRIRGRHQEARRRRHGQSAGGRRLDSLRDPPSKTESSAEAERRRHTTFHVELTVACAQVQWDIRVRLGPRGESHHDASGDPIAQTR